MKLSVEELETGFGALFGALNDALETRGIPWMVVGGIAVGAWTEPRATKDCGIALSVPSDVDEFVSTLERIGLEAVRGDFHRTSRGGVVRCAYRSSTESKLVVDVLCSGTEFEAGALERRQRTTIFDSDVYVVSADDLLIYKLIAARPQDLADADKLIRFGKAPADEDYVRKWARFWEIEDRLERALEVAER